jgi:hypothetical protein
MHTRESLEDAEKKALEILEPELSGYAKINMQALNVVGITLSALPEEYIRDIPLHQKIAVNLLVRISNDLRSSTLLALRGYAGQAVTIVSSMFESAYCIAAIGNDQSLAHEWANHDDPKKSVMGVKAMVKQGLTNLDFTNIEHQTEIEYRVYRQLCLAKHSNPLFQMGHGEIIQNGDVVSKNGPDTSENAIRAAWFAMEHAAALTFISLMSFIKFHLKPPGNDEIVKQVLALGEARKQLESQAKKRWGTKDPFPGKW